MKRLSLLVFLLISVSNWACQPLAPREINIHVDLQKEIRKFYTSKRLLEERPSLSLESCRDTALTKKFIMLGLGIENLTLTNSTIGFNFTPQEENLSCELKNNPYKNEETKEERFTKNKAKRAFFDRCVVVQVTELNENIALQYPEEQSGCSIKKISKWSVDFSGSYCFFQPQVESLISVHLDVKKECLSEGTLAEKQTILSDYNAILNSYIAGDATGFSQDLTALTTTPVRLSVGALPSLTPISEDFGVERPRWPITWQASDLYLGKVSITSQGNNYDEIRLPVVVDTNCKRKCKGNLCTSPCDYAQPVVGEFSLYEVKGSKREFLKLWHDGSVASPNFQGLLHGMGVTVPQGVLESGKKYEIEAIFREPDLDFAYFSGRVTRELRFNRNYIGPLSRSGQINMVPQINVIGRPGEVPIIPVIRNLSFENSELDGLSRALSTWQSKLDNVFWPPSYRLMCDQSGTCEPSGKGKITLKTRFELNKEANSDWEVFELGGNRESNIVPSARWGADEIPEIDCGIDLNDDDNDFDWGDIL